MQDQRNLPLHLNYRQNDARMSVIVNVSAARCRAQSTVAPYGGFALFQTRELFLFAVNVTRAIRVTALAARRRFIFSRPLLSSRGDRRARDCRSRDRNSTAFASRQWTRERHGSAVASRSGLHDATTDLATLVETHVACHHRRRRGVTVVSVRQYVTKDVFDVLPLSRFVLVYLTLDVRWIAARSWYILE